MSGGVYGGDDVGALVFDFGSSSIRSGYAGEDMPKYEICTALAYKPMEEDTTVMEPIKNGEQITQKNQNIKSDKIKIHKNKKWSFGTNTIKVPRPHKEIVSMLKEGMIEDWDIFEEVLDHIYEKQMRVDPALHPLLMSEPPWNVRAKREKLTELMIEKYNIPAFYLVKNAVLSAFANGKSTCLVMDSGAIHTTAIPVYDGYCLTNAIVRSPLGGDFVTIQCRNYFAENDIAIVPSYLVESKETVKDGEPAKWTKRMNLKDITKSYHNYMVKEILQDFQTTVLQVNDTPLETKELENMPTIQYEFPNGYHKDFGLERYQIPEGLFDPTTILKGPNNNSMLSVVHAATTSVGLCDIDLRASLYSNVTVVGGNSLLSGFTERLNNDLAIKTPSNIRLKLLYSNNSAERRFAPWIGGSIVASLGTFQQLWISRQEYDESGKHIVDKKCP